MTELAIINETSLAAVYATKQGADEIIDRIRAAAMAEAQDLAALPRNRRMARLFQARNRRNLAADLDGIAGRGPQPHAARPHASRES